MQVPTASPDRPPGNGWGNGKPSHTPKTPEQAKKTYEAGTSVLTAQPSHALSDPVKPADSWTVVKSRKQTVAALVPPVAPNMGKDGKAEKKIPSTTPAIPAAAGSDVFGRLSVPLEKRNADLEASRLEFRNRLALPTRIDLIGRQILAVRFSQASIANKTQDEMPLTKLRASIEGGWKGTPLPVVRYEDGSYTSIGNRRLYTCRQLVEKGKEDLIMSIQVHQASDPYNTESINFDRNQFFELMYDKALRASRRNNQTLPADYRDRLASDYDYRLKTLAIGRGTYAEFIYLRTHSDWEIGIPENSNVRGFEEMPQVRRY